MIELDSHTISVVRTGVVFQKPDLDTCLAALILGVTERDRLIAIPFADTPEHLLNDPAILCIEAGGSGQIELNNFDHHDPERYLQPACVQALRMTKSIDQNLRRLVTYVAMVDDGLRPCTPQPGLVQLSQLFSGLQLVVTDIEARFLKGVAFLESVLNRGLDPFLGLPVFHEWQHYLDSWHESKQQLVRYATDAELFFTARGRVAGYLEHPGIGGFDLLYTSGCEVAILSNPAWGPNRIRKYTIGSRGPSLNHLLATLKCHEGSWGGRVQVIGSPRQGSMLSPEIIKSLVTDHF